MMRTDAIQMTGAVYGQGTDTANGGSAGSAGGSDSFEHLFKTTSEKGEYALVCNSKEEFEKVKAWLTHKAGKSLDELTLTETLQKAKNGTGKGLEVTWTTNKNGEMRRELRLTDEVLTMVDTWAKENYNQGKAPAFTEGNGGFIGSEINLAESAPHKVLVNKAIATGYISTAQQLVADNYPEGSMPPINIDSIQDPALKGLMQQLFGNTAPNDFHEGHLNVLKAMNLASGDANQPASGWQLTAGGQVLASALNLEGSDFIEANHLFELDSDFIKGKMSAALAFFNPATGELINASPEEAAKTLATLKTDSDAIYSALNQDGLSPELPPEITLPDDVKTLLTQVRQKSGGFTEADINSTVAQSLIQYDRETGQISLTTQGQSLLKAIAPETSAENADAPTDNQANQEFWNATHTLVNEHGGAGLKLIDHLEGKDGGKDRGDGRFYGYYVTDTMAPMLEGETPLLNVDSPAWEEAGLGNLNTEARQQILNSLGVWAKDRGRVDQVAGFYGADGKEGRVITRDEAQAWLGRNSSSWVAEPADRAEKMLLGNAQPDSKWAKYKKDSDAAKPYGAQLGQLMQNVLRLDMSNMNDDEFNQALFILETTGYVKMPTGEDKTKVIRLTDQGSAASATPPPPDAATASEPIEGEQTPTSEEQPA